MVDEVLDNSDKIVKQIVEESDLSKEEVMKKIDEKREKYGGLLTEAGAAYSIAKDLGIKEEEPDKKPGSSQSERVKIKQISKEQKNVDLEARVKRVYATKTFQREDNEGNVTNIEIKDDTGEIRCALWNKKPLVDKMEKNTPIEITNGYIKERNGNLEINVGSYGEIEILEQSDLPEIEIQEKEIKELEPDNENIDLYARVERVFPINKFTTGEGENQREGKVTNVLIKDKTGRTRLVLWGEQAEKAQDLSKNDLIKVDGGYTKKRDQYSGEDQADTEIHLGWRGRLKINPENTGKEIPKIETKKKTISEMKKTNSGEEVSTRATIVQAYEPTIIPTCPECGAMARDGKCKDHGKVEEPLHVPILNVVIDDGEEVIRSTLYRERAEKLMQVKGEELKEDEEKFSQAKRKMLGEEKIFTGRVEDNEEFDRKEFTITSFQDIDIQQEISTLKSNQ